MNIKVPKLIQRVEIGIFSFSERNFEVLEMVDWRNGMIRSTFRDRYDSGTKNEMNQKVMNQEAFS